MEIDEEQQKRLMQQALERQRKKGYQDWCSRQQQIAEEAQNKKEKDGQKDAWVADIEPDPYKWIEAGKKVIDAIQYQEPVEFLTKTIPYSIFLTGAELFLKGMYLCTKKEYMEIKKDTYFNKEERKELIDDLRGKFGHDLIKTIDGLSQLSSYNTNDIFVHFLKTLKGIIFNYYHPLAQKWADARYPYRFYNDANSSAEEKQIEEGPILIYTQNLFNEAYEEIEKVWELKKRRETRETH